MNEEQPQYVIVHGQEEEQSFAANCWDFLIGTLIFLAIAVVLGWFGHLIWNSLGIDPELTWLNCFGIIVLVRFLGFAFNYDGS